MRKSILPLLFVIVILCGCTLSANERIAMQIPETPMPSNAEITPKNTEKIEAAIEVNPTQPVPTKETLTASTLKPTTKAQRTQKPSSGSLGTKTICIDAGHGRSSKSYKEPIAPNTNVTKAAFVSGTSGAKYTEEQLNLIVAKKLKTQLEKLGVTIIMTRETAECDLSNVDRAKLGNTADVVVRIHADGIENPDVRGLSMLVPSAQHIDNANMVEESKALGKTVLKNVAAATGAKSRGVIERADMTGFNWSTVPVILLEMGFMSNAQEDALMSTDGYQNKIVTGILNGLIEYATSENLE